MTYSLNCNGLVICIFKRCNNCLWYSPPTYKEIYLLTKKKELTLNNSFVWNLDNINNLLYINVKYRCLKGHWLYYKTKQSVTVSKACLLPSLLNTFCFKFFVKYLSIHYTYRILSSHRHL